MRNIVRHLKSLSNFVRIIFLSTLPVNEERLRKGTSEFFSGLVLTNELCQKYSKACITVCQEMDVKVVDLFNAFHKRDDWSTVCLTDGAHLAKECSKIVVDEILKVIKEADWKGKL